MSTITTLPSAINASKSVIDTNFSNLNTDKLESTDLKTVNWNSLVWTGDIVISGGWSVATDTIWDAKWDLAGWTGANTASRLAVGSNWQVLTADSAEATGLKWTTVSGTGDMLASTYDPAWIAQQVVGTTATQTFSTGVKTFLAWMLGLRNVANTFTSFFTNTNTASRTYTLKDSDWTLAFTSDITGTNSGTNTGDETTWRIWTLINGATDQPTPADTDLIAIWISSVLRKLTYANLKASLKTYFDSLTTTLTNKRVTKRVETVASSATPASNTDSYDITKITGLAVAITSLTSGLTGTPVDGDMHLWSFTDNGTARAITPGASFENSTISFPWTTIISTHLNVLCEWNTTTSK